MKKSEIKKKLEAIMNDADNNETLFANYTKDGVLVSSIAVGDVKEIKDGIKQIIYHGMSQDAPESVAWMARAIVDAVFESLGNIVMQNTSGRFDGKHDGCATCGHLESCNRDEAHAYRNSLENKQEAN